MGKNERLFGELVNFLVTYTKLARNEIHANCEKGHLVPAYSYHD